MARIIILAGRLQEANVYARQIGLHPSRYTAPVSARSIEGVAPSEVHVLPGFRQRRDTHAIMAAVKRSMRRYQGVKLVEIDERGPATERMMTVAQRYNDLRETPALDAVAEEAKVAAAADALGRDATQAEVDAALEQVSTIDVGPDAVSPNGDNPQMSSNGDRMIDEGAPADEPKRRRSRCKVCDTLHFPGECPGPEVFE